jgi:hypothetical protein
VYELYGISESFLCDLANHPDPLRRPPSRLIRGRGQTKGVRLFPRAAFDAWIERWASDGSFSPDKSAPVDHPSSVAA